MSQGRYKPHRDDKINDPPPPTPYELFVARAKYDFLEWWTQDNPGCESVIPPFGFHHSALDEIIDEQSETFQRIFKKQGNVPIGNIKAVMLLDYYARELALAFLTHKQEQVADYFGPKLKAAGFTLPPEGLSG